MRVELPALVDEVLVVRAVIADEVSVLVGGVIDARRAVPKVVIDGVQSVQGIVHVRVLRGEIVVGVLRLGVESNALGIGVQSHGEVAPRLGPDLGVEIVPILVVPNVLTSVFSDVLEPGGCDGVFVVVDAPAFDCV